MPPPSELVASVSFIGVPPEGAEQVFVVGVGKPTPQPTGEWACLTMTHDQQEGRPIYGGDSLQALCLGLSFIRLKLEDFVDKGGRLFLDEGRGEISRDDLASWFSRVGLAPTG
jgi:hypothetical protein